MNSVLHVLPHPGGGGETYVDALARMDGYRFERMFLAPNPKPTPAALIAGIRIQLAARRFDLIHVHGEVASAICLPALALRPSVVTLHGMHVLRRLEGWPRAIAALSLRLLVWSASATICVAEAERAEALETVGPRAGRRLVVIHNGVAVLPALSPKERVAARTGLGLSPDDTVGVYVGSLDERKDPLTAARAAAAVARDGTALALLFAGDGPLRADLDRFADECPAVRPLGFRDDVRAILASADFFVLPSRREGFSYALLEAMSLGLPAVVSDASGNSEAVGDAGIVVIRGDVNGFADAFRRLVSSEERNRLGVRARQRVEQRFTVDEMVRGTREIYTEALVRGARRRRKPE